MDLIDRLFGSRGKGYKLDPAYSVVLSGRNRSGVAVRTLRRMIVVMSVLGLSGCGWLINMGAQPCPIYEHPRIYGGVRVDVIHVLPEDFPFGFLGALLDIPFSLVFDTLTLPWSIPATIEHGDRDSWPESRPEPTPAPKAPLPELIPPHALVEGVVIAGDTSSYRVMPAGDVWKDLPVGMKPLPGARVQVFARAKGLELPVQGSPDSDEKGHFTLTSNWDPPWRVIRIECEGYQPLEILVSNLHSPTDQTYWRENRVLIRMAKQ
jgi:uncharacterized protein YceK